MIKNLTSALTVAGAIAATGFTPAAAGPIPTMTAAVSQAAPDHTVDVYWRGYGGWRGYGPGLAFGLAAGAIAGAAIAAPYYGGGPAYYYGAPMPSYRTRGRSTQRLTGMDRRSTRRRSMAAATTRLTAPIMAIAAATRTRVTAVGRRVTRLVNASFCSAN